MMQDPDTAPEPVDKPFIPASAALPEITFKAVVLSILLAAVMAGANAYLGLFAGMTVLGAPFWATAFIAFTAALVLRSMAILYGLTLPGFPGHKGAGEDHY